MQSKTSDYYCHGAVGTQRSNMKGEQMLFMLGDGNDTIHLNPEDSKSNMFEVEDGVKQYHGSSGDDTFHILGPCRNLHGVLDGKSFRRGNTLAINPACSPNGGKITIDLPQSRMTAAGVQIQIYNITSVIGRDNGTEVIVASCHSRLIQGNGGSDFVIIPPNPDCTYNLTIIALGQTHVQSQFNGAGDVVVLVPISLNGSFVTQLDQSPTANLFFQLDGQITSISSQVGERFTAISLQFKETNQTAKFLFDKIHFLSSQGKCGNTEDIKLPSIIVRGSNGAVAQILLDLIQSLATPVFVLDSTIGWTNITTVRGVDGGTNVFQLMTGWWDVTGGSGSDHFYLSTPHFFGSINGGSPSNSFYLSRLTDPYSIVSVDLNQERVYFLNTSLPESTQPGSTFEIRSVTNIFGRVDIQDRVVVGCDTKSVTLFGGGHLSNTSFDRIKIPHLSCSFDLTLHVQGRTIVDNAMDRGVVVIQAKVFVPHEPTSNRDIILDSSRCEEPLQTLPPPPLLDLVLIAPMNSTSEGTVLVLDQPSSLLDAVLEDEQIP